MKKRFNVAGPCVAARHYMLPAAERLPGARALIEQGAYFTMHAPLQTGQTTTLRAIAHALTTAGEYTALHFSCENAKVFGDDIGGAELVVLDSIRFQAEISLPPEQQPPERWPEAAPGNRLHAGLTEWALCCPRPLVLFFDEIDSLPPPSLISVLSQLRAAFADRPRAAPWSVVLCGLRELRDYPITRDGSEALDPSALFNIASACIRLDDFRREDVACLYRQHAETTGQAFGEDAIERAFALTRGQPWLVNALARAATEDKPHGTIDAQDIEAARMRVIRRNPTHLDWLCVQLDAPRVRRIIERVQLVGSVAADPYDPDLQWLHTIGLVAGERAWQISNPIYAQTIARRLSGALAIEAAAG